MRETSWVLYVWQGATLRGPYAPDGPVPEPGDQVPVVLDAGDAPVEVRVIERREKASPLRVVAVASGTSSSAHWRAVGRAARPEPAPLREDETFTLDELLEDAQAKILAKTGEFHLPQLVVEAAAEPEPEPEPEVLPETVGRDEPDVGAVIFSVLGRIQIGHVSLARLRDGLVETLRNPLRGEIKRLRDSGAGARRRLMFLERRFLKILAHINRLHETVAGLDAPSSEEDRARKIKLVRWIVSENVMLREEIRKWLAFEPLLRDPIRIRRAQLGPSR